MLRTLKLEILSFCLCVTCSVCWAAILIFATVLTHGILNENMSTTDALLNASYAGGVAVLLAGTGAYALMGFTINFASNIKTDSPEFIFSQKCNNTHARAEQKNILPDDE